MEVMECDVAIIGAGAAGLSAAIRLMQLNPTLNVMVLEKGSEVGAHILSGAVLEPRALNELIPDWAEKGAPLNTPVKEDHFWFLTQKGRIKLPTPPQMHNKGNYIISLGNFVRWLGGQAEAMGVQVFAGFPAAEVIIEEGKVCGVRTGAFGISKSGEHKESYQEPMEIRAKYTLFAEGCRGSLSQQLMQNFNLREGASSQTYAIGIKELWEMPNSQHQQGQVTHTIGWPLDNSTYGGSFVYHLENNQVAIGYVVGLDYQNPYMDPYMEFQRFKEHPAVRPLLEGGRRISYGARALNEGGWQSLPKLTMAGGALIGCAAGFLNVPKIKGTHLAMKSGMVAAEAVVAALKEGRAQDELMAYSENIRTSWVGQELQQVRNIRPAFRFGLWAGLAYAALETYVFKGKMPWTLKHHADHAQTKPARQCQPIAYPKPDGVISFDRLSSVYLSNTNHEEDQPVHLRLKTPEKSVEVDFAIYAGSAERFCPAAVYEYLEEAGKTRLQINAQNCVHCKTCDIKEPSQNIVWTTPEGGGGPNYPNM
jgi:electron-transferring-flavoprotein dehydrogenase